jgi:uncharacterized membrane protein
MNHTHTSRSSIVAIMVFIGLCLVLDLSSMIMLGRHSLRPKTFLIFQVIETTIWLVLIILSIVGLAQISRSSYRRPSPISYILQIVLLYVLLPRSILQQCTNRHTQRLLRRPPNLRLSNLPPRPQSCTKRQLCSSFHRPTRLRIPRRWLWGRCSVRKRPPTSFRSLKSLCYTLQPLG